MNVSILKRPLAVFTAAALVAGGVHAADEADRSKEIAQLRTQIAAAYYARGQYGVALEEVKKALAAISDYAPAYNVQALVYTDLKEWDTADESFQRAVKLDASNADSNHNYGWFLCFKRNRYADGVKYFMAAVKNPLYATPEKSLQQAGLCSMKAGDLTAAEDFLLKADRLAANNSQTLLGLAQLAWQRKQLDTARKFLLMQARVASPSAESLWLNVRVEKKLGNTDNEVGFAKELRTRFPDSDEALLLAAGKYD